MKRRDIIRHLKKHRCFLEREDAKHSVYVNIDNNSVSTLPRHKEIDDFLVNKICKDLKINRP